MNTHQHPLSFRLSAPFDLVGVATSDWQWNPADSGSDWGYVLRRVLLGKSLHRRIEGVSRETHLPSFNAHRRDILERAKEVGSNAIRLSFDFGKLCPEEGVFREDVMREYLRVLVRCRALGLEPMVTFHHWTMPKALGRYRADGEMLAGPLEHPHIVQHFRFYVERVADWLASAERVEEACAAEALDGLQRQQVCSRTLCRWFVSINEPVNILFAPYILGMFPPFQRFRFWKVRLLREKVRAMHGIVYEVMHNRIPGAQVGMSHHVTADRIPIYEGMANWGLVRAMEQGLPSDFTGIQYYHRFRFTLRWQWPFLSQRGSDPRYWSDNRFFGQVYPAGLYDVLRRAAQVLPGRPLYVTEFGFADRSDDRRPDWILQSVAHLLRAKNDGIDVRGAFLWSLTDNFEWSLGMDVPFGLYGRDGTLLARDGEAGHVSSREAWTLSAKQMLHPHDSRADALQSMRQRTWQQLEYTVR